MAGHGAGILVVDDERFYREAIGEILVNEGLPYVAVETGERAIEMAADSTLGVAVLDIRLPDIDGIQVLARLREMRPSLRVVMLSASTDQELVLEALRLGACDYLAKPLHDEELVLAVRRALETYSVTTDWVQLRGRLDRLVARMEELARRLCPLAAAERSAMLREGAVQAASEVLEADKVSLMLLDEDDKVLRVVAAVGRGLSLEEMDPVVAGEGVAGIALQRCEPMLVVDVESDPLFAGFTHTERYRSRSFTIAPLIAQGRAFGVLSVTDRAGGGEFGSDDLSLLRLLAMQISELMAAGPEADASRVEVEQVAVAAAAPLRAAEVLPKGDDGEELDRDSELARHICQAVVDEVEPARLIQAALRPLAGLLPAAPVALYLFDGETGELVLQGQCDGGVSADRPRLARDRGLTGSVSLTGHIVASQDPRADPRFDPEVDTPESGSAGPLLCLPLRLRGKVVGVFRAFLQDGAVASARTGEVLSAALSAAVRSVLLYRSLVESIEEVAEARRAARR